MVITNRLSLVRILRSTWKVDLVIIITCLITFLIHEYVIEGSIIMPPMLVTLLGTALAFFVGFNNNQSYDRWWEARIIWGALVNDSRSWARSILTYTKQGKLASDDELETLRSRMTRRHIGFVYALNASLRDSNELYYERFFTPEELDRIRKDNNISNAILTLNAEDLQHLSDKESIDQFRFMQMNQLLVAFTDEMGKCERISNTVFPTSYIFFTRLFIWVLTIFVTLTLADSVSGWSILLGWIVGFIFHITHQNGMGLINPFETIASGIPLDAISRTIEIDLLQMLNEEDIPSPTTSVNGEYIM